MSLPVLSAARTASSDHDDDDMKKTPPATPALVDRTIEDEPGRVSNDDRAQKHSAWDIFLGRDRVGLRSSSKIVYDQGAGGFIKSVGAAVSSSLTPRFFLCLLAGQLLSWAITATSTITTELGMHGWSLPATQTVFVYTILNLVYTPYTIYRYGFPAFGRMLLTDGWKYAFLAAVDVEANFLVVKAYQYTDLLSCMLLDAWATPACMIFAWFLVKARYHWSQVLGVVICIAGLCLLFASDHITDKNNQAARRVLGDILMLIGATGYGLSNALEEYFVRRRPLYEVVGQMGFWGMIINGIQGPAIEHAKYSENVWNGVTVGYLMGYTAVMLFLYTLAPILFRLSSSPFYNLSILTSDFYGLLIGLRLFGFKPYWLYFVAYALVLFGLIVYFSVARPEATSEIRVEARGKRAASEAGARAALVVGA